MVGEPTVQDRPAPYLLKGLPSYVEDCAPGCMGVSSRLLQSHDAVIPNLDDFDVTRASLRRVTHALNGATRRNFLTTALPKDFRT